MSTNIKSFILTGFAVYSVTLAVVYITFYL